MARFLIEVTHASKAQARKRIDHAIRSLGSHFVTHADWQLKDGNCSGTMIVEANDKWGALGIVPPVMRSDARIIALDSERTDSVLPMTTINYQQPLATAA